MIDQLAERAIKAAQANGEFDDLPGQGKPLQLDDDSGVPADIKIAYRILKNAGYVPAEVALLLEIQKLEVLLAKAVLAAEKADLVVKVSLLKSRL